MKTKFRSLANIFFLFATLGVNYLANSLPIGGMNTGELSDLYPNLFVPAGFTFSIWGVIYSLLFGFVVWQRVDAGRKESLGVTENIGPWFVFSCVANIGWILAWHYRQVGLSVLIMLMILISLIVLSKNVQTGKKWGSWTNKLFAQVPFGVYLGWISVATIANITAYLVHIGRNMRGMTDIFWTILVIGIATILGCLQLYKYANVPFALVVVWAFYGIRAKRIAGDALYANDILTTLTICCFLLVFAVGLRLKRWIEN